MNERIALVRKENDLTQDDFAMRLGLTKNFISLIETGKREPSDRTIKDICLKFGVNETWLRTGEGEMLVPKTKEDAIAELTLKLLAEKEDSFKNRLIAALAEMSEDQWEMLADLFEKIVKKEQD